MTTPKKSTSKIEETDLGNAKRLVRLFGKDIRYCHAWGEWLIWDGTRWQPDGTGEIQRLAKLTVQSILNEAARAKTKETSQNRAAWGIKSQSERAINAMVRLAQSEIGIPVTPAELDSNPYQLNCLNGTLDLCTGKLQPHRRDDFNTKLARVRYDPNARDNIWQMVLSHATRSETELEEFFQRAFGYSMTGDTSEEVLFLIHGPEASSKSTIVEAIKATLGDYALTPTLKPSLSGAT